MGEPSLAGHEPARAVDGDVATGWDPGEPRGPGDVRGWLRVILPRDVLVSEIRVLLSQPAGGSATYEIAGWTTDGRPITLEKPEGPGGEVEWQSVPGPTPCLALRSVDLAVTSVEPAAEISEIEILGTSAP